MKRVSKLRPVASIVAWMWMTVATLASAAQTPTPVTVTNTAANPIPVTGNININGTANVSVTNTVPIVGNVGITGTPAVNVTNTVPVTGNVSINGTSNVLVANPADIAKAMGIGTPATFGFQCLPTTADTSSCQTPAIPIPAGKRFVLETVSYSVYNGILPTAITIGTTSGVSGFFAPLPPAPGALGSSFNNVVNLRLYIPEPAWAVVTWSGPTGYAAPATFFFSGQMVDIL